MAKSGCDSRSSDTSCLRQHRTMACRRRTRPLGHVAGCTGAMSQRVRKSFDLANPSSQAPGRKVVAWVERTKRRRDRVRTFQRWVSAAQNVLERPAPSAPITGQSHREAQEQTRDLGGSVQNRYGRLGGGNGPDTRTKASKCRPPGTESGTERTGVHREGFIVRKGGDL